MRKLKPARRLVALGLLAALAWAPPARAGQVLTVTSGADSGPGSLREALALAQAGDRVAFDTQVVDYIVVRSALAVPAGVTVGGALCGPADAPAANLGADGTFSGPGPVLSLGAGARLTNIALARVSGVSGPALGVQAAGAGVELCGVAIGAQFDRETGEPIPEVAPFAVGLTIGAPQARVRRSIIHGPVLVAAAGDDSIIGDAPGGAGEANLHRAGFTGGVGVTVYGDAVSAAQRVTVRDAVARSLFPAGAVVGGDDVATHPNGWAAPPQLSVAPGASPGSVEVRGVTAPYALVDLYAGGAGYAHLGAVAAGGGGAFSFSGGLPAGATTVCAAATLGDPAHPGRAGSSSPLSACLAPGDQGPAPGPTPSPAPGPVLRPASYLPLVIGP